MKGLPNTLYIDSNEPENIINVLRPAVENCVVAPLNLSFGKADYYWLNLTEHEVMIERKQTSEAISDIDAVDEQLQRHLHNCDELSLLVEGVAMATPNGVMTYKLTDDGKFFRQSYEFKKQLQLWARWESYKWSLWHDRQVYVAETNSWQQTAHHILSCFNQSMKSETNALTHYTHGHMAPLNPHDTTVKHSGKWFRNLQIENLTRMKDIRIGETTAKKLIAEFGTFHNVINASYTDLVAVMGGRFTDQFLKGIGRE